MQRAEHRHAPPPERAAASIAALEASAAAERAVQCDAPRNTGWRPGARWARGDVERQIEQLPVHQRPPLRELGRRSEAAAMPFRRLPGDDGGKSSGWNEPPHAAPTLGRDSAPPIPTPSLGPLVTVHRVGSRIEIAAVSPAAAAIGIAPGMVLTQARAAVPTLDVREADHAGDRADLERLAVTLARRWAPIVAISDVDGLFLDLSGVAHLHGGEEAMAKRITRLLARLGVSARIAVADTAGAAWALARFAACSRTCDSVEEVSVVESGRHLPALVPLPIPALRLDDASADLLDSLGIGTIGELLKIPRAPLVRRFGNVIARRIDQATGAAPEPLDPVIPPARIAVTRRFAEPIATAEAIAHWLGMLVADLTDDLAKAGLGARALIFAAQRVDASVQTIRVGLARPTRDAPHILRLIARRIEEMEPGYGIDALTLHVRRADPLGPSELGAHLGASQAPDLAPLVDTLANRIGAAKLWRHQPHESDVPERSVASRPPLDPPKRDAIRLKLDDVRRLDTHTPDHPWHPRWPRPIRLLRRPEQIDHVLAELPDFPPLRFTWRGATHRIVRGDGPERITGEWWRDSAERDAVRDYFRVEDDTGKRFWLFRRGDGQRSATGDLTWYMHGTFG